LKRVFLAIPTISGKCVAATETAIQMMELEAESVGWKFTQFRWSQDSLIAHARNVCVAKFLESDATDMFFLDSDVACGPGAFTRLLSHDADVVAAVYRVKNDEEKYPVRGEVGAMQDQHTGLLEATHIPFGFVRIRRDAIQRMVDADPDNWFTANVADNLKCPVLFNTEVRDHQFWGEDFYFCRKWRDLGGKIYFDPDIRLAHVNSDGKAFTGSFSEFVKKGLPQ
jgi:hypothetical protein